MIKSFSLCVTHQVYFLDLDFKLDPDDPLTHSPLSYGHRGNVNYHVDSSSMF